MHLFGRNRIYFRWHFFPFLRNRIVTKFSRERMAAQKPLHPQPDSARQAESFNRVVSKAGAGWLEPAASREQHGEVAFVTSQRKQSSFDRPGLRAFEMRDISRPYAFVCGVLFSRRNKSAVSAANGAPATELFGCMTMSHPAGISRRWQRTISRTRRRIRLRVTALPSSFLMLNPKRLSGCSLARTKTVK
jgi:hypothetical protein